MSKPSHCWTQTIKDSQFIISTDNKKISREFIQAAFATDEMDWAKPVSPSAMELLIENACTMGIYAVQTASGTTNADNTEGKAPLQSQIGFARIITDYVTIAYLTDVYIDPKYRDLGLGKWLLTCYKEIVGNMPALRRSVLLTGASGKGPVFYERELGMKVFHPGDDGKVVMMQIPDPKN